MNKKEIKLHMGFMDENGNLVEIPENIQKHIEAREEFWANKIKEIDSKCGIVLERLELTEKTLELACKEYSKLYCEHYCHKEPCDECENGDYMFFKDNFLETAKEMIKNE